MTTAAVSPLLTKPVDKLTHEQITLMQLSLSDWAGLNHYRESNAEAGEPKKGEPRVVFFGDSITAAWGLRHGHFFPDEPWINRGIGGQTTPQMLVRFQQDVIKLQPKVVVILAGINDIAGNTGAEPLAAIEDNFRSMVTLAKDAHIRVVLSSVLPAPQIPWVPGTDPREEIGSLNKWLEEFAAEQSLVFLNYYPAMVAADGGIKPELAEGDVLHPNDSGYVIMEPLARTAVAKALAMPAP